MQTRKMAIIFDGNSYHVSTVARLLREASANEGAKARAHAVANADYDLINTSDTIVFGSPASFGTVSTAFKQFMESMEAFWYLQPWKNKFATGLTVSPSNSGDESGALQTLSLAAYHGMHWISLGVLPRFVSGFQTDWAKQVFGLYGFNDSGSGCRWRS